MADVLIVDDEAHIRLLIEQTIEDLEDEGVEILTAGDGEAALETVKAERPALVLLDVMMPKLNGFDVCQRIKGDADLGETTVFLLTAKGQEYDQVRGQEAGADAYITKPFDPDALLEAVRRALGLDG